tara:strand:- start:3943 stop:4110 length:168 start_codon:yes stop_codon:yes gene_type:complete
MIQKFKDLFFKPDVSDQERIDRWHKEAEEADRLKTLHRQARKQINKKNKTLSSNF